MPKNAKQQQKTAKRMLVSTASRRAPVRPRGSIRSARSAPIARSTTSRAAAPSSSSQNGTKIVKFREYIDTVGAMGNDFSVRLFQQFKPTAFPWLKVESAGWERYEVRSLRYVFEAACSSTTVGSVVMCLDYDVLDAQPAGLREVMNNRSAVVTSAWQSATLSADPRSINDYTKTLFVSSSTDRATSPCSFTFATDGVPAGTQVGRLFVEYDILLKIQQQPNPMVGCVCAALTIRRIDPLGPFTSARQAENNAAFQLLNDNGNYRLYTQPGQSYVVDIMNDYGGTTTPTVPSGGTILSYLNGLLPDGFSASFERFALKALGNYIDFDPTWSTSGVLSIVSAMMIPESDAANYASFSF